MKINSARHQHDTERTQNRAGLLGLLQSFVVNVCACLDLFIYVVIVIIIILIITIIIIIIIFFFQGVLSAERESLSWMV